MIGLSPLAPTEKGAACAARSQRAYVLALVCPGACKQPSSLDSSYFLKRTLAAA